jgi:hypothetical protein
LAPDQEQLEHEFRVEQMQTAIDKSRLNMKKLESDLRWEGRKFAVSAFVALAAAMGAGAALGNSFTRNAPAAPQPQVIYMVPGQAPPPVALPKSP